MEENEKSVITLMREQERALNPIKYYDPWHPNVEISLEELVRKVHGKFGHGKPVCVVYSDELVITK